MYSLESIPDESGFNTKHSKLKTKVSIISKIMYSYQWLSELETQRKSKAGGTCTAAVSDFSPLGIRRT